ncbi:MAG: AAA family ATPase [Thermodesulfobacteria bacterium]|nr:AAA family ATPase [Thermodesulfobacteriota bacterium]
MIVSFVGKGGTGKTTLSALFVNYLVDKGITPVLAVDADPNFNLNELLGVKIEGTLSDIRESLLRKEVPEFMSGYDYVEMKVNEILVESKDFDLLVMGYPETSGCYCPVHAFLSQALDKLLTNYPITVVDNEAGMEHISRLNLRQMEHLIVVTDANPRGILTANRIGELINTLRLEVKRIWLVVNQVPEGLESEVFKHVSKNKSKDLTLLGLLPEKKEIVEYELKGIPVFDWNNEFKQKCYELFDTLMVSE